MHTSKLIQIQWGSEITCDLCIYRDSDVPMDRVQSIAQALNDEFSIYGIFFNLVNIETYERKSFFYKDIAKDIRADIINKDHPECDRSIILIDRNFGDFVYGLIGLFIPAPEILGFTYESDSEACSHAMVVAGYATINNFMISPEHAAVHEMYHQMGCWHALTKDKCYDRIIEVKRNGVCAKVCPRPYK